MLRRLAALAFAVAVIAGALAIRNGGEGGAEVDTNRKVDPYEIFDDDEVSVLCAEDLVGLCEQLRYFVSTTRVEPAWATVDRLAGGGRLGADAWLTLRPLPEMATPPGSSPGDAPLLRTETVARSPIVLAGPPAAVAAVEQACPDPRTLLSCAGAAKVAQVMLRDPAKSAAGALALSVLVEELGVRRPGELAGTEAGERVRAVLEAARITPIPYEDVTRLESAAVALTLEAEMAAMLNELDFEVRQNYDGVAVLYPFEVRAAEVVMAPARDFGRIEDLAAVMRSRPVVFGIERAGFEVAGRRPGFVEINEKVFARRPTLRIDLRPPAPARLTELRTLRASPPAGGGEG